MQTCYIEEEKEAHLLLLLLLQHKKKVIFFLLHVFLAFFWLQYFFSLWHAIALLHGIKRRNMHVLLFLVTTYPMLFILCCISLQFLCFFGCDAS